MKLDRICNGKERLSLTTMEKNVDNKRSNEILGDHVYCNISYIFKFLIASHDIVILFIWCKILFINELIETRQGNYIDGVTKETAKHQKTS